MKKDTRKWKGGRDGGMGSAREVTTGGYRDRQKSVSWEASSVHCEGRGVDRPHCHDSQPHVSTLGIPAAALHASGSCAKRA